MIGATMSRNGTVPDQKPRIRLPRLANQWAR